MQIIPSGGPLGAEVAGIDMRHPLDAGKVAELKQAWNDHLVLVLRGQFDVSLDDHMTFSRHFGELALSPRAGGAHHPQLHMDSPAAKRP